MSAHQNQLLTTPESGVETSLSACFISFYFTCLVLIEFYIKMPQSAGDIKDATISDV